MNEKLQKAITLTVIFLVIIGALYLLVKRGEKERGIRLNMLNKGYKYGRGIITKKFNYKGNSITVEYTVNKKSYENIRGWDINPRHIGEGDSITFKYAIVDPVYIITEMSKDYYLVQ